MHPDMCGCRSLQVVIHTKAIAALLQDVLHERCGTQPTINLQQTTPEEGFRTQESQSSRSNSATKRRCCWRNAVNGFSCSRDRSSLSCAPAPRTSNTTPPRCTCMATVRPNRPNHSTPISTISILESTSSSRAILSRSRVGIEGLGPPYKRWKSLEDHNRSFQISGCTKARPDTTTPPNSIAYVLDRHWPTQLPLHTGSYARTKWLSLPFHWSDIPGGRVDAGGKIKNTIDHRL